MRARPVLDRNGEATGEYVYDGQVANGALKLLGDHLRMFPTKFEHDVAVAAVVNFTIGKGYDDRRDEPEGTAVESRGRVLGDHNYQPMKDIGQKSEPSRTNLAPAAGTRSKTQIQRF